MINYGGGNIPDDRVPPVEPMTEDPTMTPVADVADSTVTPAVDDVSPMAVPEPPTTPVTTEVEPTLKEVMASLIRIEEALVRLETKTGV